MRGFVEKKIGCSCRKRNARIHSCLSFQSPPLYPSRTALMTPVSDSVEVIFVVQQLVFLRQHMVRQSIRSDEKTLVAILYNFQFGISALE